MDNKKNDTYFIERIRKDLMFIVRCTENIDLRSFSQNEILQDSMMFRLIQISENARKLSDTFRYNHPIVPWTAVFGLRNRIVHDYGNVDLTIVFDTLKTDIPDLLQTFEQEL